MSLFVSSSCQIIGETIVNRMEWSKSDHLAALSIFSVDDNEKEINQVVFSNNEVYNEFLNFINLYTLLYYFILELSRARFYQIH